MYPFSRTSNNKKEERNTADFVQLYIFGENVKRRKIT